MLKAGAPYMRSSISPRYEKPHLMRSYPRPFKPFSPSVRDPSLPDIFAEIFRHLNLGETRLHRWWFIYETRR